MHSKMHSARPQTQFGECKKHCALSHTLFLNILPEVRLKISILSQLRTRGIKEAWASVWSGRGKAKRRVEMQESRTGRAKAERLSRFVVPPRNDVGVCVCVCVCVFTMGDLHLLTHSLRLYR